MAALFVPPDVGLRIYQWGISVMKLDRPWIFRVMGINEREGDRKKPFLFGETVEDFSAFHIIDDDEMIRGCFQVIDFSLPDIKPNSVKFQFTGGFFFPHFGVASQVFQLERNVPFGEEILVPEAA